MDFLLASGNKGKLYEIENIFKKHLNFSLYSLKNLSDLPADIVESYHPEENGVSFLQNAFIKGNELFRTLNKKEKYCIIAEDSGLEVDALNGAPGIFSSRFAKDDESRIRRLLDELKDVPDEKRSARFITVAVLMDPDGNASFFTGKAEGLIARAPKGENGFGYDPVFFYAPEAKTFAEMSKEKKNSLSHRYKAFENMIHYLNRWSIRLNK